MYSRTTSGKAWGCREEQEEQEEKEHEQEEEEAEAQQHCRPSARHDPIPHSLCDLGTALRTALFLRKYRRPGGILETGATRGAPGSEFVFLRLWISPGTF